MQQERIKAFKKELGDIFDEQHLKGILFQLHNDRKEITAETVRGIKDAARRKNFREELGDIFNEKALKDILFDYYNDGKPIEPKIL